MAKQQNVALKSGSKLQQYTISRVLSTGGFSIVYLAYNEHGIPVAIKEFMPANVKLRTIGENVSFEKVEDEKKFQIGLKSFFKEAEAISRIDDKSVVRILNFFLANNTAYLVMPFEQGQTLQKVITRSFNPLTDNYLQKIFCDVLRGVNIFHEHKILHLDLKPSNIWIRADGSAMIIDFGTSKIGDESKYNLTSMHTPGFAAPEQHKKNNKGEIGEWTDIYNLGATFYSCIECEPPQIAPDRLIKNKVPSLKKKWMGFYSIKMLEIIDQMISLEKEKRPQSTSEILNTLSRYSPLERQDSINDFFKKTMFSI